MFLPITGASGTGKSCARAAIAAELAPAVVYVELGEVLAAPSADQLDGIRACLLHADPASRKPASAASAIPPGT